MTKAAIREKAKWSYEDYAFLPAELRCEIIDQSLFMAPAPSFTHQNSSLNLTVLMRTFCKKTKIGTITIAPMDVVLSRENVVQPDILFVAKENFEIITEKAIKGIPDCVVEIISPGYMRYDRVKKMELYERFQIPEYWIVDPANQTVEIFTIVKKKYQLFSTAEVKGKVESKILKGFTANLKDIFKKDF